MVRGRSQGPPSCIGNLAMSVEGLCCVGTDCLCIRSPSAALCDIRTYFEEDFRLLDFPTANL